mmetsp:Transcript_1283/g.2853  ORF Transcript_1283/g.2853 Transcript_1283/m.2853 type:complete len:208 (-) Transcript_1283:656-1279(-)
MDPFERVAVYASKSRIAVAQLRARQDGALLERSQIGRDVEIFVWDRVLLRVVVFVIRRGIIGRRALAGARCRSAHGVVGKGERLQRDLQRRDDVALGKTALRRGSSLPRALRALFLLRLDRADAVGEEVLHFAPVLLMEELFRGEHLSPIPLPQREVRVDVLFGRRKVCIKHPLRQWSTRHAVVCTRVAAPVLVVSGAHSSGSSRVL